MKEVEQMPGVVAVVCDGSFLGVVAEREEQAIRAERRLARIAQWNNGPDLPTNDPRHLLTLQAQAESEVINTKGDPSTAGTKQFSAEYTKPYLAHASLAPSCALAQWGSGADSGKVWIWTHSQGIYPLRGDMAQVLGLPESDIIITHAEGAGCYGHNAADDVTLDAVLLARAVPGRPVRVQWMREDEHGWDPKGPPQLLALEGPSYVRIGKSGGPACVAASPVVLGEARQQRTGRRVAILSTGETLATSAGRARRYCA